MIATSPPIFVPLVAAIYARLAGASLLLDSHPDSFRTEGPHARFHRLHSHLVGRARATLVTTDELAEQVSSWGGTALIVHEPPPAWEVRGNAPLPTRPRVLVLGTLAVDEPAAEVIDTARLRPDIDFELTGDTRRCPPALIETAPGNVRFLGFLHGQDYVDALQRASIVLVLTTWLRWAVPRSAYDAVYGRRPLVVSDSDILRQLFPFGVPVDNEPAAIAAGLDEAIARHGELAAAAAEACELQTRRWDAQLESLRAVID